jgi:hypothetical protein
VTAGEKSKPVGGPSKKSKVVRGLVIAVAWLAMFVVVSAAIADRAPAWAAGVVGGVVAIAPALWHWLRERRRTGTPGVLTGGDRLVLRLIVIGGLAIAIAWSTARGGMWSMLKRSATWWWPTTSLPATATGDPSALIPSDADVVGWIDLAEFFRADDELRVVFGSRDGVLMGVFDGKPAAIDKFVTQLERIDQWIAYLPPPMRKDASFTSSRLARNRLVVAPKSWPANTGTTRSPLLSELRTIPPDANGAIVLRGVLTGATTTTIWAIMGRDHLTFEARILAHDKTAMPALIAEVKSKIAALATQFPEPCRGDATKILDRAIVLDDGATVRAELVTTNAAVGALVMCAATAAR